MINWTAQLHCYAQSFNVMFNLSRKGCVEGSRRRRRPVFFSLFNDPLRRGF